MIASLLTFGRYYQEESDELKRVCTILLLQIASSTTPKQLMHVN